MSPDTTGELRAEIAQTRADLGDTIEALAAKTDMKARAKDAIGEVTDQAKARVREVRDQGLGVAGVVGAVRKPLPIAGLAMAAALVGLIIYLVRRRGA